jgi:hypothetical protein
MKNLSGRWIVEALGMFWLLNLLGDIKVINGWKGYNLAKGKKWGHFGTCQHVDKIWLDYDQPQNGWILRQVLDIIEAKGPDIYEGTFYWKGRKVMRFRMIRIK